MKVLALALLAMMGSRIIFAVVNPSTIPTSNFIVGLLQSVRYDLTALAWILLPVAVCYFFPTNSALSPSFKKVISVVFTLLLSLALLFNLADTGWFAFQHKRSTADVFSVLAAGNDFKQNLPAYLMDYWYLTLIWLISTFAIFRLTKRWAAQTEDSITTSLPKRILALAVVLGCYIIAIRGGVQLKPLSTQVAATVDGAEAAPLILNTPYTLIKSAGDRTLSEASYLSPQEAATIFPIHFNMQQDSAQKKNVVLIILESFSKEYTGKSGNPSYTPFLDSLADQGIYFNNAFANAKRSIEGLPAVLTSIPALMDQPFITSPYNTNRINSLATILKQQGYSTAFFHGGSNGTMGFDNFTAVAGYQKYYGRSQYDGPKTNDDGHWGIYDHAFYQFMIKKLNTQSQPFTAAVFSLSSHHPYTIPAEMQNRYKEGPLPILKSIMYADDALRSFFNDAVLQSWFANTVFIITADHTGPAYTNYGKSEEGTYSIPLLIYSQGIKPEVINDVAQQIDILPTGLFLAGYQGPYSSLGRNLFDKKSYPFAVNYANDNWQLITNDQRIVFDGVSLLECQSRNQKPVVNCDSSALFLKAIIQLYNHAMISNTVCGK